ncbi:MAG: ATP-binding protein [Polyangiales bacterium]|nr:HAMP domain-containing protein [Myxococcales bacterium]
MSVRQSLIAVVASSALAIVMTALAVGSSGATGAGPLALVAIIASIGQALALLRLIHRPVADLTRMAKALAAGDAHARTAVAAGDEFGQLAGVLNVVAAEQGKRLASMRTEEERLRTVLDGMVEAVFVTDGGGEIVLANRASLALVHADPVGRKAVEVIESPALREALWAGLRGEASSVSVDTAIGKEERSLSAQVSPLPEHAGVVVVIHDVTELKRVERIRRDFVANASHELRTPLTAIRGFSETLKEGALDNREMAGRFVDKILTHSLRLQRLADDLIALSRAETPSEMLENEPIDLREALHEVVASFEAQASLKHIAISEEYPSEPVEVSANRWALEHVCMNLVDNAIKYTQDGGRVTVRFRKQGAGAVIEVSDNGAGIPREHQDRIFERFYRVDGGRSRDRGGTGLGLAIVKHLTQRMGAEIRVESETGKGTTFILTLR